MSTKQFWRAQLVLGAVLAAGCGSPSPAELLEQAREAVAAGEPRTADIHLRNLLLEEPENAAARRLLGEVQLALGNPGAAATQLRRAVELGVPQAEVHLSLVRALVGQGEHAAALEELESGPELTGEERVTALRLEAAAHRALGDVDAAEAAYRAALALEPGSPDVRTGLAEAAAAAGRTDEARELVEGVLASNPEFVLALMLRGNLEMQAGAAQQAEGTYRDVLRLEGASGSNYTGALARLVELLLARSAVEQAAERADELLERAPQNPIARTLKARVEHTQGQTDAAERRLESVVADFPDFAPANQLLGAINAEQQQFGQAEMYLRTAMQNASDDRAARLLLVQTYLRQGEIGPARELLGEAFPADEAGAEMFGRLYALAPSAENALLAFAAARQASLAEPQAVLERWLADNPGEPRVTFALGQLAFERGETDAAVEHFETVVESAPNHAGALNNLAWIYEELGDGRALDMAQRAYEAAPQSAAIADTLGWLYVHNGDAERGLEFLEQAVEGDPGHAEMQYHRAVALAETGRSESAVAAFETLLEQNSDFPGREDAERRLAELRAQ